MIDLSNRKNSFYWQTDRELTAEDYAQIFLKRNEVDKEKLVRIIKNGIHNLGKIISISIDDPDENVVKGNVNIVRKVTINNEKYVVRMHPFGVRNGYFYSEKMAIDLAISHGILAPKVIEIHEAENEQDMDFMLMVLSPGITMDVFLSKDNTSEKELLFDCGRVMAEIHKIDVNGFGPFDNKKAKEGILTGLHGSYHDFVHAGLEENIERLIKFEIISESQATSFRNIFHDLNFEPIGTPKLIHNDFADWNVLTDGHNITAVLDWDESHAGDPIADLACWSTFFNLDRVKIFMDGYKSVAILPDDFGNRFHFYRLRYTISKMALRVKRYQVDKSESLKERLEIGKKALTGELEWFGVK